MQIVPVSERTHTQIRQPYPSRHYHVHDILSGIDGSFAGNQATEVTVSEFARRDALGGTPETRLNARLNEDSDS